MTNQTPQRSGPWQPRFGLGAMMLVVLVCAMLATAGRYLIQATSSGTSGRAVFVMFVLVVPMFLLLVLNGFRLLGLWWNRAQRRRRK